MLSGAKSPAVVARAGQAFKYTRGDECGVFVVEKIGSQLWGHGAASEKSKGLYAPGLAVVEAVAITAGCESVGFQTDRPGVVRIARKNGYKVIGFILEKKVSHGCN